MLRKVSQLFQSKNSDSPRRRVQAQHTQDIPNNNNPSRDTPPSLPPTCPSEHIPRNILAFRTITKLLSQIQQEKAFQVSRLEAKLPQPHQRLELRLSNAFSTVAVIEHEVVAVVTKRAEESLQVIACTQTSINQGLLTTPLPPRPLSQVWHLLFTQNDHRSDAETAIHSTAEATISEAKILAGIDFDDDRTLKLYVDEYW